MKVSLDFSVTVALPLYFDTQFGEIGSQSFRCNVITPITMFPLPTQRPFFLSEGDPAYRNITAKDMGVQDMERFSSVYQDKNQLSDARSIISYHSSLIYGTARLLAEC